MKQLYFFGNTAKCKLDKLEDGIYMEDIEDYYVLMISDGNGGQVGDINTGQLAINIMSNYLHKIISSNTSIVDILESLDFGFYTVSQAFLAINAMSEKYRNIYSSLSLAIISKTTFKMVIASTGNTEIQLIRNGKFQRINRVYSETYEALNRGEIEEKDFYIHPGRCRLTSAIGVFPEVSADILAFGELKEDDVILMTTDGIYRYITPIEVIDTLATASSIEEGVNTVLKKVDDLGGEDNATLAVGHLFDVNSIS